MVTSTQESGLAQKNKKRKQRISIEPGAVVGLVIILVMVFLAVLAPVLAPFDPSEISLVGRLKAPGYIDASGNRHVLGTDHMGRDVLSRIVHGARISLFVGIVSVSITAIVGTVLGMLAGYVGGAVETLVMRFVEITMTLPSELLALALIGVMGSGLKNIIIAVVITRWAKYARIQYGQVMSFSKREFIQAAKTIGASGGRILFKHMLPNILSTSIVLATLDLGAVIIFESSMSYLGFGVPLSIPTWGSMLADGRAYVVKAWWMCVFPGIAIMCTVLGFNLLGDWVRDKLDPTLRT